MHLYAVFVTFCACFYAVTARYVVPQRRNDSPNLGVLRGIQAVDPDGRREAIILAQYLSNLDQLKASQKVSDDFTTFTTTIRYPEGENWVEIQDNYTDPNIIDDQSEEQLSFMGFAQALQKLPATETDSGMSLLMTAFEDPNVLPYRVTSMPCRMAVHQRMGKINPYAQSSGPTIAVLENGDIVALDPGDDVDAAGQIVITDPLAADYASKKVMARSIKLSDTGGMVGQPGATITYTLEEWQYVCQAMYSRVWHRPGSNWQDQLWKEGDQFSFIV